jgi:thiol-disulfide isomerase/thioredoxin
MKPIGYVVIAVAAAAAGFGTYRISVPPQGEPLPAAEAVAEPAPSEAAAVQMLPDFSLQDRDGAVRSIKSWPGKSMIVNFWATWCAPCRREIPLLKELQQTRGAEGFQVVGVAVDFRDDVLKYAADIGIDYPLLIGEQDGLEAVTKFGVESVGFPFTVFTDSQGRIVALHLGELTRPQSEVLIGVVTQVNRGELTPEAARAVVAKQLQEMESARG